MGYASCCDRPVKATFQSVYDPIIFFEVCGIHKKVFAKYVARGSFIELAT